MSSSSFSFRYRGHEQHGCVKFTREGLERQRRHLSRMASLGINRAYVGEGWPDLCLGLIDYRDTFPELVVAEEKDAGVIADGDRSGSDVAGRRAIFREMCDYARTCCSGIEIWPSLNILNFPHRITELYPEACAVPPVGADRWWRLPGHRGLGRQPQLCASSETFSRLACAQIAELCRVHAHVAGIECWLTAGDMDLFYCHCPRCRTKTPGRLIGDFATTAYGICKAHGKKLLLRTYLGGWRGALEPATWREAAALMPAEVEIAYKQQAGDFMTWHDPNPLAGRLAPHQEHVEFDLGGEYRGTVYGVVSSVRWQMRDRIRHYRDAGVTGIACRGLDHPHAFDVDHALFGALSQDADIDVGDYTMRWARERYGDDAAGSVLEILDACTEIAALAMYVRGVQWASWAVPHNLARLRFILFDRSAPCVTGAAERLQPTDASIAHILEEKQRAMQLAAAVEAKCVALKGCLSDTFHDALTASCQYQRAYVSIAGPLMECFFRFLQWEQTSSEVTRERVRLALTDALNRAEEAVRQAFARLPQIPLHHLAAHAGRGPATERFSEPFCYAQHILCEIRTRIAIEPASWWACYPEQSRWPSPLNTQHELYRTNL